MSCRFCRNAELFQAEYANGGKTLHMVSQPTLNLSSGRNYVVGDLGYTVKETRSTTTVELICGNDERVEISGDLKLVLNILEKLK